MSKALVIITIILSGLFFCSNTSATTEPDSGSVVAASVGSLSLTADDLNRSLAMAESLPRLHSILLNQNDELVVERYFNGKDANDLANVKSVSKSIISALVGIAIERGKIAGVDQAIADYFPKHLSATRLTDAEKNKLNITVGDLLSMQSGLRTTSNRYYGAWVLSDDWVRYALESPLLSEPGSRMTYSTGNTHLLSAIIAQVSGGTTLQFAREHLTSPMGFYLAAWPQDPNGIYFGGNDMELTPRQMLAFGELYLNGGRVNNKQVIPEQWVKDSLQARVASPRGRGRHYGYGWWIRDTSGYETPFAWGYGGQFIVLVPELDLVLVITSESLPGDGRRQHTRAMYRLVDSLVSETSQALRDERI